MEIPCECRFCANVKSHKEPTIHFRCSMGRYDKPAPFGAIYRGFAWIGIIRTNKVVKEAQKDCPAFSPISEKLFIDLYPRIAGFYKNGYMKPLPGKI